jgi:hypothetical protein
MTPDYLGLFLTGDLMRTPEGRVLGYGKGESQKNLIPTSE